jgi:ketosteroid isomerase-like protein
VSSRPQPVEARSPLDVDRIFVRAMNEGDIETIMSLYSEDTVFVQGPDKPDVTGLPNLRALLLEFLAYDPTLSVELKQFVRADDIAFFSVRWILQGTDPATGEPVTMTSADGNVVRRQPDGSWKTLIDNPFHEEYLRS